MKILRPLRSTSTDRDTQSTYRPDIDGLRAVAILCVVIFHAFPAYLRGGFIGVDIFFVISGFLISSIIFRSLKEDEFSFTEFYARRVRRIFPALIVVLGACFIFGWFALLPDEYAMLGKHMAAGAGFVQNFVLWKEAGYFDVTSELKPLMHLWSLAIEEQFYLLYPLLIWLAWRAGLNVLLVVLTLLLLSFGLNMHGIGKDAVKTFFLPQTRFWELLVGAILAYGAIHGQAAKSRLTIVSHPIFQRIAPIVERRKAVLGNMLSVAGALLMLASVITIHRDRVFPGAWALLPVSAAGLLILAGPNTWINRTILSNRLMVGIGLISYPLYLWHWPLLSFVRILESGTPSHEGIRIAAVALSFLLAWVTWRFVERPIRSRRKTWVTAATLTVTLAAIGYVGYNAFQREGLPFRSGIRDAEEFNKQLRWKPTLRASEECRRYYHPEFPGRGFCVVSSSQVPSVVLIGDSHANHLYPGLAKELANTGETIANFGDSACPPLFNTRSYKRGDPDTERCLGIVDKMLEFAEQTTSVHTVVMADIGAHYLHNSGKGYGKPEEGPNEWVLSRPGQTDVSSNDQVYEEALRETLVRLTAKGKRVILVLDNPNLRFSPRSCIQNRPIRLDNTVRTPCAISREEFDGRNKIYRALVKKVSREIPHVQIFDAGSKFCDDQWCSAIKDGKLLYRDSSHLSVAGSEYVASFLAPLIRQH